MKNKKEYLEFLVDWLSPLGGITTRSMFGGHTLYCNGVIFAIVADNALYLKVDDANRPRFEHLGLEPIRPFPDRPEVMQYYPPPASFFDDTEVMKEWAQPAIEAGNRAQSRKRRRGTRAAGR